MSEVDRLNNSGLYPALPVSDKRGQDRPPADPPPKPPNAHDERSKDEPDPHAPRTPKSIIDEYA
jgi:hypothetical protein